MKEFNDDFKSELYQTIEDIENSSQVEIVAIFRGSSGKYRDVSLWVALTIMFITSSFFMFSPIDFDVYMIWLFTFIAFVLSYFLTEIIKPFKRIFVSKKRMKRHADLYARAVFQKGGIRFTNERIGVLFYFTEFERRVVILPDRGSFSSVPDDYWTQFENGFQTIFNEGNIAEAFLKELKKTKQIFAEYILPVENDINELPDDLEIEI